VVLEKVACAYCWSGACALPTCPVACMHTLDMSTSASCFNTSTCAVCLLPVPLQVDRCVSLLLDSGRLPEAALFARSYAPSLMKQPLQVGWL
jgi:hypothetical protein